MFQGSPLSSLLYVLACQPLAAHVRLRASQGACQQLRLPNGVPAPAIHQHADDTTIHTPSLQDARSILDNCVGLHCRATAALLQLAKSKGLPLGTLPSISGVVSPSRA